MSVPNAHPLPQDLSDHWTRAYQQWLAAQSSPHTRRAYERAWSDFTHFIGKPPWAVEPADVSAWIDDLSTRPLTGDGRKDGAPATGYAETTVKQYLAAVASFYVYVSKHYRITVDGETRPLHPNNPARRVEWPKVVPYGGARCLSPAEAHAFFSAIPRDTLQGLRDYALLLIMVATGRRTEEIVALRWGDFLQDGSGIVCDFPSQAAGQPTVIPPHVWRAIGDYLNADGREGQMAPQDYIFIGRNNVANRLPVVQRARQATARGQHSYASAPARLGPALPPASPARPLSARQVGRLVKRYAREAGLDPHRVHPQMLRHTAALVRHKVGDTERAITLLLGYAQTGTTRRLLRSIVNTLDTSWAKVEDLLGL